jgi:hypothetical protein
VDVNRASIKDIEPWAEEGGSHRIMAPTIMIPAKLSIKLRAGVSILDKEVLSFSR